jgi:ribosomal protein S18 acetylase RimI-like enzyme
MTDLTIRLMAADDRLAVIAILLKSDPWKRLEYDQTDWDRYFAPLPVGRDTYVAELHGKIAGIAVLRQNFLLGDYLELFGITQTARGKGVGEWLLAQIEALVFARAKNLCACVSDFNESARRFYRKHGYQEVGQLPNLLIQGSAEILIRKTTGPGRPGGDQLP